MNVEFSEQAKNDPNCEIRLGIASWDDSDGSKYVTPARIDFAGVILLDILYRIMYIVRYRRNV